MLGAALAACAFQSTPVTPQAAKDSAAGGPSAARGVSARDSMLEQRVARLDLRLAERDAQVEDLQALRAATGGPPGGSSDVAQAGTLVQQASGEFAKQNYGGALYLANQAKSVAGSGRSRLAGAGRPSLRPGEVPFAVPVRLQATARGKVRDGPGAGYRVLFTVAPGAGLIGYSYVEQWVRVADESGRAGWMFLNLVGRRATEPGGR